MTELDWRLQGQERYPHGVAPTRAFYTSQDHAHCEFCSLKFMAGGADGVVTAYTTTDQARWVCLNCFRDFKDSFGRTTEL